MNNTTQYPLGELIARIEQTHHVFTRAALAQIKGLLNSTDAAGTAGIRRCFEELEADLLPHLMKEERILFPYIVALEGSPGQPAESCFGSVANPIGMMNREHRAVDGLLQQLRGLTDNYRALSGPGPGVPALYSALAELDRDLVEHMHQENDVLFPQALELERNVCG